MYELGGENLLILLNTNGLPPSGIDYTLRQRHGADRPGAVPAYPNFLHRPRRSRCIRSPASGTTEEHVFQQHHQMLIPNESEYYPYAIGGKTGYTSDALSTLITMADNGNMQLVCVVLKTHGVNVYPDTRNLLEYVFQNFQRLPWRDK